MHKILVYDGGMFLYHLSVRAIEKATMAVFMFISGLCKLEKQQQARILNSKITFY